MAPLALAITGWTATVPEVGELAWGSFGNY